MILYHGTPMGGRRIDVGRFLAGRNALISYARPEDLGVALEVCQTVVIDNGAYTAWKSGSPITDWEPYYRWLETFHLHPAFQWAIIPDVIGGSDADNDGLIAQWPKHIKGIPVWHLNASLDRLSEMLTWDWIAIGSGHAYPVGSRKWHARMAEAMDVICDENGMPRTKLHGLKMANPAVFTKYPFASVDSTNVARNRNSKRVYPSPNAIQRAEAIAARLECVQSPGQYQFTAEPENQNE